MKLDPKTELSELSDEALLSLRETEPDVLRILLKRYHWMAAAFAGRAADNAADAEDFMQEGLMGLSAAVMSFSPEFGASFRTYAAVCIRRRIATAAHAADNAARSVGGSLDDPEIPADSLLADEAASPELLFLAKERAEELSHWLTDVLSRQEKEIFCLQLSGFTYAEIAGRLHISLKSVENAIQRARRKLRAVRGGGGSPSG